MSEHEVVEESTEETTCSTHVEKQYYETAEAFVTLQKSLSDLETHLNNLKKKLDKRPSLGRSNQLFLTSVTLEKCGEIIRKRNGYLEFHSRE